MNLTYLKKLKISITQNSVDLISPYSSGFFFMFEMFGRVSFHDRQSFIGRSLGEHYIVAGENENLELTFNRLFNCCLCIILYNHTYNL